MTVLAYCIYNNLFSLQHPARRINLLGQHEKLLAADVNGGGSLHLLGELHDAVTLGLASLVRDHHSALDFSKHAERQLQQLVGDHWVEVGHLHGAAAGGEADANYPPFHVRLVQGTDGILSLRPVRLLGETRNASVPSKYHTNSLL